MLLPSFAKINWILKILGKRPDGFHELRTILQAISLSDQIAFQPQPGQALQLKVCGRSAPTDDSNLICRAAALMRPSARRPCGVRVILEKNIPLGAGLGGGSSNAAVALLALNQLWDCGLGHEQLSRHAARLGSDVPFFLRGGMALASGRGEILHPLPDLPKAEKIALLYPGLEISAAKAYSLGNWRPLKEGSVLTSKRAETKIQRFCEAAHSRQGLWSVVENDFEAPLYKHFPALEQARDILMEAGCSRTLISGSGSTVVGLGLPSRMGRNLAGKGQGKAGELLLCRTLSRREYGQRLGRGGLEGLPGPENDSGPTEPVIGG